MHILTKVFFAVFSTLSIFFVLIVNLIAFAMLANNDFRMVQSIAELTNWICL